MLEIGTPKGALLQMIAALVLNSVVLVILIILLSLATFTARRLRESTFKPLMQQMIQVRRKIKSDPVTLDEFLAVCAILDVKREQVTEIYDQMHKDRREVGENWLFRSDGTGENRRKVHLFKSFAATSQFTQGRLGYRMHQLLHRPTDYQNRYTAEAFTMFDITRMTKTVTE